MYKLEKIPLPERKRSGNTNSIYPWRKMEIGDSFFVPEITIKHMSGLASLAGKRMGKKFTCRSIVDGVRVWRIK